MSFISFRKENIDLLASAIEGDEFNDVAQIETKGDQPSELVDFLKRNIKGNTVLECGCGSGRLIDSGIIASHYLEPSKTMLAELAKKACIPEVKSFMQGVIEYIPWDIKFDTIFFMNGFFQVRSDFEAIIEISNHLTDRGIFCTNIHRRQ